ncbi:restriction endonuclease subunit S [Penaeicola halotolerans]|uniref:restriction endonuclease subunit S n=1 Tax=Penaeicola halotolerans TaxID=2793196 RepID=UPI001CF8C311|nr:restriction endonuclease subunit S [Penaeicola halotolerans]
MIVESNYISILTKHLPAHWDSFRIGSVFVERTEKVSDEDYAPLSVTMKGVVPQLENVAKTTNGENRKRVCINDFVINSRSDRKGSGGMSKYDGSVSLINTVLKPNKKYDNRYTNYLLTNVLFQEEFYKFGKGIVDDMWSTKYFDMKYIKVPCPPLDEQISIANYLDKQSKKIKHFIQKKQAFIELLKEQRQAVINHKLIIEDRKVKIKYCVTKIGAGVTPTGGATVYKNSGVIFLRSQNIHNDGLRLDDVAFITEDIHNSMNGSQVKKDDVLINITGASIGRTYVFELDEEANVNQHVCILRPIKDKILPKFLMLQLQSDVIQNQIKTIEGASREGLTNSTLKNYYIYTPSIERQMELITEIKTETAKIDQAIAKAEKEIELIKEYREAMIAEAVLGKLHHKIIKPEVCQTTSL